MQSITYLKETIYFKSYGSVGGYEEGSGPLGGLFDFISENDLFGMKSFERAEGEMSRLAVNFALKRGGLSPDELSLLVSGDLQNQCVASTSGLFSFGVPYLCLYGACSTLTEGLIVSSAMMNSSEKYKLSCVVTSSHNCAAERQFRSPLEYGGQRTPTCQWTATASGSFILSKEKSCAGISAFMPGRIIDSYICDATNMGAAMAPSTLDTLMFFFGEGGENIDDYDLILTGDLGKVGSSVLEEMLVEKMGSVGRKIKEKHRDAGLIIYDRENQDVHSGGSGCGCSASVLATYILPKVIKGDYKKILLMSTGALMSQSSVFQGEHIMGITPCIRIEHFD